MGYVAERLVPHARNPPPGVAGGGRGFGAGLRRGASVVRGWPRWWLAAVGGWPGGWGAGYWDGKWEGAVLGGVRMPNTWRRAVRAASSPQRPCTPGTGGTEAEHRYTPRSGVAYGFQRGKGPVR